MPGPLPKPAHKAQGHREHRELQVLPAILGITAPPPTGILKKTADRWAAFWDSPVARAADPITDLPAIARLFQAYDELERVGPAFRKARIVEGSTGQPTLNPLAKYIATLTTEITALEDRFGLTPKSRLALGIAIGQAKASLNDLITAVAYDDE
ncbi:MAG: P27 family phage terminase small subunit [Gemmatimonadaceae bacterium]|nr:P27 family phage terminase small subunit [Gemmatimonadaceae bacterium]